jgi:acetyl-CoA carboxylase biotin carboxyl carrier protein
MFQFNEIKELMDKMQKTNLGEFYIKNGDFELKLEAKKAPRVVNVSDTSHDFIVAPSTTISTEVTTQSCTEETDGNIVKSPIVGTFYAAAAPDKPPFVTVGSKVKKGDVLCIIESMKLMNEIKSDFDGEVAEIKVENAQGVEYGQPLMVIR